MLILLFEVGSLYSTMYFHCSVTRRKLGRLTRKIVRIRPLNHSFDFYTHTHTNSIIEFSGRIQLELVWKLVHTKGHQQI